MTVGGHGAWLGVEWEWFCICQLNLAFLSAGMRISGGLARGIPLRVPPGDAVRPATDSLRQAVFSSIASRVEGAWFWDFFAGSGAYGLEALSRGASGGVFVEKNHKAAGLLRQNIAAVCKSCGREEAAVTLFQADVTSWKPGEGMALPDLVFIDPPYGIITEVAPRLFGQLGELLAPKADPVIIFETPGEIVLEPAGWSCVKRLGRGARQPTVNFFRATRALP